MKFLAQSFLQPIASSLTSPCTLLRSSSSEGPIYRTFLALTDQVAMSCNI